MALQPKAGHYWVLTIAHSDALQSVGLILTSEQLVAETYIWQHTHKHTHR